MRRLVYCLSAVAILAAVVSGCRKRNMPGSSSPATVEITVKDTEGKPVAGEKVMMYGYAAFSEFQKDHSVKAASEALTDIQGKAVFTLEYGRWFRDADRQDFMFVVLRSPGADNYRWWAEGGTVSSGETRRFSITVDPVPDFSDILVVEDGVLTGLKDKSVTELVLHEGIRGIGDLALAETAIKSITLNEGLEFIGKEAFRGSAVEKVVFPASLKEIRAHAFEDCASLGMLDLSGTALAKIDEEAFRDSGLSGIVFPETLTEIGAQAFMGTARLKSISFPAGLRILDDGAFRDSGITEAEVPSGLETIGNMAFYNCSELVKFTAAGKPAAQKDGKIGVGVFELCGKLAEVSLPENIVTLSGWTFIDCQALKTVVLGSRVKKIGDYGLATGHKVEKVIFMGQTPPELGTVSFPSPEGLSIYVPKGCRESYIKGWTSYSSYHNIVKESDLQ